MIILSAFMLGRPMMLSDSSLVYMVFVLFTVPGILCTTAFCKPKFTIENKLNKSVYLYPNFSKVIPAPWLYLF